MLCFILFSLCEYKPNHAGSLDTDPPHSLPARAHRSGSWTLAPGPLAADSQIPTAGRVAVDSSTRALGRWGPSATASQKKSGCSQVVSKCLHVQVGRGGISSLGGLLACPAQVTTSRHQECPQANMTWVLSPSLPRFQEEGLLCAPRPLCVGWLGHSSPLWLWQLWIHRRTLLRAACQGPDFPPLALPPWLPRVGAGTSAPKPAPFSWPDAGEAHQMGISHWLFCFSVCVSHIPSPKPHILKPTKTKCHF